MRSEKKPSLAILIGMGRKARGDKDGMADEGKEPDGDEESPHVDAAQAILDAVSSKDAEALSEALKVFYTLCKEEHSDDDGDEY